MRFQSIWPRVRVRPVSLTHCPHFFLSFLLPLPPLSISFLPLDTRLKRRLTLWPVWRAGPERISFCAFCWPITFLCYSLRASTRAGNESRVVVAKRKNIPTIISGDITVINWHNSSFPCLLSVISCLLTINPRYQKSLIVSSFSDSVSCWSFFYPLSSPTTKSTNGNGVQQQSCFLRPLTVIKFNLKHEDVIQYSNLGYGHPLKHNVRSSYEWC